MNDSSIGVVLSTDEISGDFRALLVRIQNDLFDVGADLCTPVVDEPKIEPLRVVESQVAYLEAQIDKFNEQLEPLDSFILPSGTPGHRADYDLVRKMRASINVLGPLVARTGQAEVALPGGDAIGSRGLDFHIKGLESLGAKAHIEHGYVIAEAPKGLVGAAIELDFPSVGATENIMTAAVLAQGVTTIDNAAREPDIVDLGEFLIAMGAKISGLGSPVITIEGVKKLNPATHATIADRIITGTWAFAAVMTKGDITIHGARPQDLEIPLEKLTSAGAIITSTDDGIRVRMDSRPQSIDVSTLPYPGFPTDLLPMVIALNSIATGDAIVTENVFESRFMFVNELTRLGAQITVDGHHASIHGISQLSGAPVEATDIRAGAGLVLAAEVSFSSGISKSCGRAP